MDLVWGLVLLYDKLHVQCSPSALQARLLQSQAAQS